MEVSSPVWRVAEGDQQGVHPDPVPVAQYILPGALEAALVAVPGSCPFQSCGLKSGCSMKVLEKRQCRICLQDMCFILAEFRTPWAGLC